MSTEAFWKAVAGLGGYLARTHDGPPGWKTLRGSGCGGLQSSVYTDDEKLHLTPIG